MLKKTKTKEKNQTKKKMTAGAFPPGKSKNCTVLQFINACPDYAYDKCKKNLKNIHDPIIPLLRIYPKEINY